MLLIVHKLKHRLRLKSKLLYRNQNLCIHLQQSLLKVDGVNEAKVNHLTGSILIVFNGVLPAEQLISKVKSLISEHRKESADYAKSYRAGKIQGASTSGKVRTERSDLQALKTKHRKQDQQPCHFLRVDEVLAHFKVDGSRGLTKEEVSARFKLYGPNRIPDVKPRSGWEIFFGQLKSLPLVLLCLSSLISIATGGIADGMFILGAVVINAFIGYATESQSERIILSLKSLIKPTAMVLREGEAHVISAEEVVPGDILILKPGQYISADARVIEAHNLTVDESALTGESLPVLKTADVLPQREYAEIPLGDRVNMVYMGTLVTGGQGLAVVVSNGVSTELGRIQSALSEIETLQTPLERQLDELGKRLILLSGGFCLLVMGFSLLRGYGFLRVLHTVISLATAAIPEGLPAVGTTTLALGVKRMKRLGILVRKLEAVETLGKVQTICLDKTGTITKNQMSVEKVFCGGRFYISWEQVEKQEVEQNVELRELLKVLVLCNEATFERQKDALTFSGSSTEVALLEFAFRAGLDLERLRKEHPLLAVKHRTEQSLYMATLHEAPFNGKGKYLAIKGSPLEVLNLCNYQMVDGWVIELTEDDRDRIVRMNEEMAYQGMRVLGVAFASGEQVDCFEFLDELSSGEKCEFVWLGLVGLVDPIRSGVKDFIKKLHSAGISTVMITGDQAPTAYAVAKELNLSNGMSIEIFDSSKLDLAEPEVLSALSQRVHCFARVSPAQKLLIVKALQRAGKIVAMTGDGINDGPALKAADVGISMGKTGTDVARSVADVIVEDDDLENLVIAIEQGRAIYQNIRKAVHYMVSTNLSELILSTAVVGLGLGEALSPTQLLWINLVSDVAPALSLSLEQPEEDLMERLPRDPREPIIVPDEMKEIYRESAIISATGLGAYLYGIARFGQSRQASGTAFLTLTLAQIIHTLSCRSRFHSVISDRYMLKPNQNLTFTVVGTLLLQGLTLVFPPLRSLLGLSNLGLGDALVAVAGAAGSFILNESIKKGKAIKNER